MEFNLAQKIAVFALPIIFAITLHEASHGYVARRFGDMTAHAAGRISLNPLRHIDLVGTIIIPLASLLLTSMMFGWAKPVPVDFSKLRQPKRDMLWVAAAGPLSNLIMAFAWGIVFKIGGVLASDDDAALWMLSVGACGVFVNVIFFVLNLLPIPPLDGGRIAVSLLPHRAAWRFAQLERFGFIILIALLASGVLNGILWPLIRFFISVIGVLLGIESDQIFRLMTTLQG